MRRFSYKNDRISECGVVILLLPLGVERAYIKCFQKYLLDICYTYQDYVASIDKGGIWESQTIMHEIGPVYIFYILQILFFVF